MNLTDSLSEREKEVALLLLQGKSNKQIAQALDISIRTAEFHASNIYAKLGVSSRAEAIIRLSEANLRESTGENLREPEPNLRGTTVAPMPGTSENKATFSGLNRRPPMKKILLIIAALVAGVCLLAVFGVLLFNISAPSGGVHLDTSSVEVQVSPSQTPYQTLAPSQTPYETLAPSQTPYQNSRSVSNRLDHPDRSGHADPTGRRTHFLCWSQL